MNELYAVEGKQSFLYNHFKDCKWDSCVATDTRLMGVIAMKITWKCGRSKIYQILHLDFSEYGIDDYLEYFTDPAMADVSSTASTSVGNSGSESRKAWAEEKSPFPWERPFG